MEAENGVTGSIIDDLHLWISNEFKWKAKVVLIEVSLMNFILGISNEIKCKMKVVLLEVSFMNFILWISKEIQWKVRKWFYSKYH